MKKLLHENDGDKVFKAICKKYSPDQVLTGIASGSIFEINGYKLKATKQNDNNTIIMQQVIDNEET